MASNQEGNAFAACGFVHRGDMYSFWVGYPIGEGGGGGGCLEDGEMSMKKFLGFLVDMTRFRSSPSVSEEDWES